jgi:MEMO1 family protein
MRKSTTALIVLAFGVALWTSSATCGQPASQIREPAVAGQFYPADAGKLRMAIQAFMKDAVPPVVDSAVALVIPHAGYVFAGQVFADAYGQVRDQTFDTVVILGTNHTTAGFTGVSVFAKGAYRTPLGLAAVDEQLAAALLAENRDCRPDVAPQVKEHSVEVQVPFVQVLFPAAKILPIVVGEPDPGVCRKLGEAIARTLKAKRALIVASSDLSHYPEYDDAVRTDRETLQSISSLDTNSFAARCRKLAGGSIRNLGTLACGEAPVLAAMTAAKAAGAVRGVVVSYANSGDALVGDRDRVVGYGAVAFTTEPARAAASKVKPAPARSDDPIPPGDRKALLGLARETLRRYLSTETVPLVRNAGPRLETPQGVFVTLRKHGQLRGCIGHFAADTPLARAVGRMALEAALNDTRFSPLRIQELPEIEIEISALTVPKPIGQPQQIRVGRDGVIFEKNGRSATFLPQVPTEFGWGLEEMLDNLCEKAGLARGAWRSGARFQTYQAEVFGESDTK